MQIRSKSQPDKQNRYLELYVIDDYTEGRNYEHRQRIAVDKDTYYNRFASEAKKESPKKRVQSKRK